MRNQTPLAPGDVGNPEAKRLVRIAAERWRESAELAQRQETEGLPIPAHFGDASEAVHYAQDHKFALYWQGTHAFTKRQRELGDRFVARPVFTSKGATYVGLVPLDEQEKASEKENVLTGVGVLLQHLRQIPAPRTAWIIHIVRNLLRALGGDLTKPVDQFCVPATFLNQTIKTVATVTLPRGAKH